MDDLEQFLLGPRLNYKKEVILTCCFSLTGLLQGRKFQMRSWIDSPALYYGGINRGPELVGRSGVVSALPGEANCLVDGKTSGKYWLVLCEALCAYSLYIMYSFNGQPFTKT
jgi:hypothetical protein